MVNFPSNIAADYDYAESAFAVEERSIRHKLTLDNTEPFAPCHPMQNFCGVSDGKCGLAFFGGGLREYEIRDDKYRTVAITLLRTHRAYMTANPDMTPDEFDKYTGMHSFGDIEYNYAVYPHKGGWREGKVQENAYDFKVGMKAIQGVPIDGELPSVNSFIEISEPDIVLAAIKQAEDKDGFIIRLWNKSDNDVKTAVKLNIPHKKAYSVKMNETDKEELDLSDKVTIGKGKIFTIKIEN